MEAAAPQAADGAEQAVRTESVSMALLVVLETLTPLERAVFVLNEVFGYAHTEIAEAIERSPAAVRQIARRARSHVHARRPRYDTHPRVQQEVTERFVEAALGGDVDQLMQILAPEVTVWTDGGGKVRGAGLRPVHGRDRAAQMLAHYGTHRGRREDLDVEYRTVGGDAAAVVFRGDSPYVVMVMDLTPEGDQVSDVYIVTNPDKLAGVSPDGDPVE